MPRDRMVEGERPSRLVAGEHERHLAIGAIAQQTSQVVATLSMLAAITVLARRLSLSEFGTYGLLLSLTSYVVFVQGSVETAAVKAIAEATDQPARDRAFSSALTLYITAGLGAGTIIASAGTGLLTVFHIPVALHHEAQVSVLALGAITAVGWPFKVFQDVLRGSQRFVASAAAEALAFIVVGGALVALGLARAALWTLVMTGASVPVITGAASSVIVRRGRMPYRFERAAVTRTSIRSFLGLSTYLFFAGIADLVIYSLDRAVLGIYRSAATVGLYEGPARAHGLLQTVHSALLTPVVSASTRYAAEDDVQRTRDLLLRGARYTLAVVAPLTIVVMVLAKPILKVWLGPRFSVAATAMVILAAYWLVNGSTGVPGRMLVAAGRARTVALYAGAVAIVNLALSLALTPSLGLNGVVLGTTVSYVLAFPFFLRVMVSVFPVGLIEFAREVLLPAYATGAVMAAGLIAVRLSVSLQTVPSVLCAGLLAVVGYWAIYYFAWLRPNERALIRDLARMRPRH